MRFRPLVPAAVLACALAASVSGCGGDSAAEEGSGASPEALEKVAASDYARAVNLRQSDVPYLEVLPDERDESDSAGEERRQREAQRCLGMKSFSQEPMVEVRSPSFGTNGPPAGISIESSVGVEPSSVDVEDEVRRFQTPRAVGCMRKLFLDLLEEEETVSLDTGAATVKRLPFRGPEVDGGYGFRFAARITLSDDTTETVAYSHGSRQAAGEAAIDFYVDFFGFPIDQAVVTLNATGMPSPVSRNLEANLLRVLHERATSHSP